VPEPLHQDQQELEVDEVCPFEVYIAEMNAKEKEFKENVRTIHQTVLQIKFEHTKSIIMDVDNF